MADRAYESKKSRQDLLSRDIRALFPEKNGQITTGNMRGSIGGQPPAIDAAEYQNLNVVERTFAYVNQWRGSYGG